MEYGSSDGLDCHDLSASSKSCGLKEIFYVKVDGKKYTFERGKFTLPVALSIENYEVTYRETSNTEMKCKVQSEPMFILAYKVEL